jgi:hypothetical protein
MSASEWTAIDDLIRDLGAVRRAATEIHASTLAHNAIERAIVEAAEAVDRTIDAPRDGTLLTAAREAVGVATEVILALDAEVGHSLRVRKGAQALRGRAAELIREARGLRQSSS